MSKRTARAEGIMGKSLHRDDFLRLKSVEAIRTFLSERGRCHERGYYHYTGVNAMIGMLRSRMLHLTRGDVLNDRAEGVVGEGRPEKWGRTYVASFAFGKTESVAMWAIYGDPIYKGVRIRFDKDTFVAAVQAVSGQQVFEVGEHGEYRPLKIDNGACVKAVTSDVVYALEKSITWDGAKLRLDKSSGCGLDARDESLLGVVKNFAWRYEKETRILVTLPCGMKYPKRIAVPFGKAIDAMSITRSPCMTKEGFDRMLSCEGFVHSSKASNLFMQVRLPRQCRRCPRGKAGCCPLSYSASRREIDTMFVL